MLESWNEQGLGDSDAVTISQDARGTRWAACRGEDLDFEDEGVEVVEMGGELIECQFFWTNCHGVWWMTGPRSDSA